jgi:hypothetical protein
MKHVFLTVNNSHTDDLVLIPIDNIAYITPLEIGEGVIVTRIYLRRVASDGGIWYVQTHDSVRDIMDRLARVPIDA